MEKSFAREELTGAGAVSGRGNHATGESRLPKPKGPDAHRAKYTRRILLGLIYAEIRREHEVTLWYQEILPDGKLDSKSSKTAGKTDQRSQKSRSQ